ncbi:hypothetical protein C8N24_3705 [Solirubrobacter pauli]|uniref:HEAT repeat domain-containing protein n=1 Tax=Solirubrobacter pauli TaxID=166793 RepID=A0A660LKL6_9ACTN|nr:hypothetical protein [Solirubrobacter pauli]RKQ93831.1 hypothetical protein C8N24_3705 [Solirubrobacter pauli]
MLMLAKQGWDLVQGSRKVYEHWKRLPDADRELTRASAERVGALGAELSKALAMSRFRRDATPGGRGADLVASELQTVLKEIATGPLGVVALAALRPKGRFARAAVTGGGFVVRRINRKNGAAVLPAGPASDPAATHVAIQLDQLRAVHREHDRSGVGLANLPQYNHAMGELFRMGPHAVPPLIAVLGGPRPSTDTPEGLVEDGVANDIAEVLGAIGDPEAIDVLVAQFDRFIVAAHRALAQFSEGVETLLAGLDAPDDFTRGCCIQGLAFARVERTRAAQGVTQALGDGVAHNRELAALSAQRLACPDPQLLAVLDRLAMDDPSERVRAKALQTHHELASQLGPEVSAQGVGSGNRENGTNSTQAHERKQMGWFSKGPKPVSASLPDPEWSAASRATYVREVSKYYGTPETMADGGRKHLAAGDPGTAVHLLCKSIDMMHTAYGYAEMRDRQPGPADQPILDDFCEAVAASLAAHPQADLDEPVREVTHRLRAIAHACEQRQLPAGMFRLAHDRLGRIAPRVPTDDLLWA